MIGLHIHVYVCFVARKLAAHLAGDPLTIPYILFMMS